MMPFSEALASILNTVGPLETVSVPLEDAPGFVLATDVVSDVDLPPFDRSAMDGYALRADDIAESGTQLTIAGYVVAGQSVDGLHFDEGECCRILTGAPVPACADTVIQQELTELAPDGVSVRFATNAQKGANIALHGEDVRVGDRVLESGRTLTSADVSFAAASGADQLTVFRRPRVAVLSTGDELVAPGGVAAPGQIRDANGPALTALFRSKGYQTHFAGIAQDRYEDVERYIQGALASCDVLAVSAGVSVGDRDFVPEVLTRSGFELHIKSIAMKPGKPTKFGTRDAQVVFGVPGNPVSALVVAHMLILPALRRMSGLSECASVLKRGVLLEPIRKKVGRIYLAPLRVVNETSGSALPSLDPVATHGSADLAGFSRADALAMLPSEVAGAEGGEEIGYYDLQL